MPGISGEFSNAFLPFEQELLFSCLGGSHHSEQEAVGIQDILVVFTELLSVQPEYVQCVFSEVEGEPVFGLSLNRIQFDSPNAQHIGLVQAEDRCFVGLHLLQLLHGVVHTDFAVCQRPVDCIRYEAHVP